MYATMCDSRLKLTFFGFLDWARREAWKMQMVKKMMELRKLPEFELLNNS